MNNVETLAKWILRLIGAVLCCSFVAIFLPLGVMSTIHEWLGLGTMPDQPIFEYLARSLSAMYLAHGVFVLAISTDAKRYWPMLGVLSLLNMFLGVVLLVTDLVAPMPWYWTLLEGPPVFGGGLLLFVIWIKGKSASNAATWASSSASG